MSTTFTVTWAIEVEADSPREAAEKARSIQQEVGNYATYFSTLNWDTDEEKDVDLSEDDSDDE